MGEKASAVDRFLWRFVDWKASDESEKLGKQAELLRSKATNE